MGTCLALGALQSCGLNGLNSYALNSDMTSSETLYVFILVWKKVRWQRQRGVYELEE